MDGSTEYEILQSQNIFPTFRYLEANLNFKLFQTSLDIAGTHASSTIIPEYYSQREELTGDHFNEPALLIY